MRIAAVVLTAALLTGCLGDDRPQYEASDYRAGDCRSAAEPAFSIRQEVARVVSGDAKPADAVDELKAAQERLIEAVRGIGDEATKAAAQRVVDTVGFYRIGVDAQNFTPNLAKAVQTASESLLSDCSA